MLKVHFNGFWPGFMEGTDCNNMYFFLIFLNKIFNVQCVSGSFEESTVLVESIFGAPVVDRKIWSKKFLFSGESRLNDKVSLYDIVLWGCANRGNIVNLPLYLVYLQHKDRVRFFEAGEGGGMPRRMDVPVGNSVLAIISNANSPYRNKVINKLENAGIKITFAGNYRNNIGGGGLRFPYYSDEQIEYMRGFKFVLAFENSRCETYITEKIVNPLLAQTIPIYYGAVGVTDYFNPERFINIVDDSDESIRVVVDKIVRLTNDPVEWLEMVNKNVYGHIRRTCDDVATDVVKLLGQKDAFMGIDKIYCIADPSIEPVRYEKLSNMFARNLVDRDRVRYMCPSWGTRITDQEMRFYVKSWDYVLKHRPGPVMRKSEISLFLNNIAVMKDIVANNTRGVYLILESDSCEGQQFNKMPQFMRLLMENTDKWDVVFIGKPYYSQPIKPYFEEFTGNGSEIRIFRGTQFNCADAYIWKYETIKKFLEYIDTHFDFKIPYDNYLEQFYIDRPDVKYCWVQSPTLMIQTSFSGQDSSTIQGT